MRQVGVGRQEKEKKRFNSRQSLKSRAIGQWSPKSVSRPASDMSISWEPGRSTDLPTELEILVVGPRNLC